MKVGETREFGMLPKEATDILAQKIIKREGLEEGTYEAQLEVTTKVFTISLTLKAKGPPGA